MKRTLLFVITQFYRGGAETTLVNLLKALSRKITTSICWYSTRRRRKIRS